MRPYGIPRCDDAFHCDVADGRHYARKASAVNLAGPGGDIRSNYKNAARKQGQRRRWKRAERARAKRECEQMLRAGDDA